QYAKAATGLYILRETVMGHELFDKAFKEYAQRWAFKHPKPADFFRTMEDASAVDLDWFWRGWFYTTDHVDQSIDQIKWYKMRRDETVPEKKNITSKKGDLAAKNGANEKGFNNFDNGAEPFSLMPTDPRFNGEFRSTIDDQAIIQKLQDKNLYEVTLSNKGGVVMPVLIEWTVKGGSKQIDRIPGEIWRISETKVNKIFVKDKEGASVVLDPLEETSDINTEDNVFPKPADQTSKFDEFKKKKN